MLEAVVSQIRILDGDLGKSGQTTTGREDFHQLMATVPKLGNIWIYLLTIEAGMDRSSLRRIVNGTHGATWDVIEKIARGLSKIHPQLRGAFIHNLNLDEDAFEDVYSLIAQFLTKIVARFNS